MSDRPESSAGARGIHRRITLATCDEQPGLPEHDRPLIEALRARGFAVDLPSWDDEDYDWAQTDLVLPKATWDYPRRLTGFRAWIDLASRSTDLVNSAELMRWNLSKRYLRDLEDAGVPIVPTTFLEAHELGRLREAIASCDSEQVILKPEVGASAEGIRRFDAGDIEGASEHARAIAAAGTILVQPFLPEVLSTGEFSLIFIDGELTHTVLKSPRPGDYRSQYFFGGSEALVEPTRELLGFARHLLGLERLQGWVYGRVDVLTRAGQPVLGELELIEPCLFLDMEPRATERLADYLTRRAASR